MMRGSFVDSRSMILQEESTRAVLKAHVEPTEDIAAERRRATFDAEELKYYLWGGKDIYDKKSALEHNLRRSKYRLALPLESSSAKWSRRLTGVTNLNATSSPERKNTSMDSKPPSESGPPKTNLKQPKIKSGVLDQGFYARAWTEHQGRRYAA